MTMRKPKIEDRVPYGFVPKGRGFKITCEFPGYWKVSRGDFTVLVERMNTLPYDYGQWVVRPLWEPTCSDPLVYLSEGKKLAKGLIEDAEKGLTEPPPCDLI